MDAPDPIAAARDALDGRIAARLAELAAADPELAKLNIARDALAGLCGAAPVPVAVPTREPAPVAAPVRETPPGKPTPPVPAKGPGDNHPERPTHHCAARSFDRRLEVARLIAREGPQRMRDLQTKLGVPNGSFAGLIAACPWFVKSDPADRQSPWTLSPVGRSALAAAPAPSSTPG